MKTEEGKEAEKEEGEETKKKTLMIVIGLIVLVVLVSGVYLYGSGKKIEKSVVNMTAVRDIGVVKVRGDGIPGYDIDRDGKADYLSTGFGYYKELYELGGFEYGPGGIELEEFGLSFTLPVLHFKPDDIVESGVGSVVSFAAENGSVSVTVIYKTLGPALSTYTVFIDGVDGESYIIIDSLTANGSGTIEEGEVEIVGRVVFWE